MPKSNLIHHLRLGPFQIAWTWSPTRNLVAFLRTPPKPIVIEPITAEEFQRIRLAAIEYIADERNQGFSQKD